MGHKDDLWDAEKITFRGYEPGSDEAFEMKTSWINVAST